MLKLSLLRALLAAAGIVGLATTAPARGLAQ